MHRKPYESQTDLHPGSIDNEERLCITGEEADQQERLYQNRNGLSINQEDFGRRIYLKGTGKVQLFDPTCVDMYLRSDVRERTDYKVIDEELWQFLHSRYGGSVIKRFTIPQGTYYTQTETRPRQISLALLPVDKLYAGGAQLKNLE